MTRAAMLDGPGAGPVVVSIDVPPPAPGEVLVRVAVSGLCPLDLDWEQSPSTAFPAVLGHEGAGRVVAVGAGVTDLAEGDQVVLTRSPSCGWCYWCSRGEGALCEMASAAVERPDFADATSAWSPSWKYGTVADHVVLPQAAVMRIHGTVDLVRAGRVGCGILTGVASIRRTRIKPGDSVAVFGLDGVGVHLVQAARLVGAAQVVAVDAGVRERSVARRLGATTLLDPTDDHVVDAVRDLTAGRGVDVAVVSGRGDLGRAIASVRRGGRVLVVGGPGPARKPDPALMVDVVRSSLSVVGFRYGSSHPREDVSLLLELASAGTLELEHDLVLQVTMDDIGRGLQMLRDHEVLQVVVVHD